MAGNAEFKKPNIPAEKSSALRTLAAALQTEAERQVRVSISAMHPTMPGGGGCRFGLVLAGSAFISLGL